MGMAPAKTKAPEETVAIHVMVPNSLRKDLRVAAAERETTLKALVEELLRDGIRRLPRIE